VHVCRQLQDARLRDQQRPTDSLDQVVTELISESPHHSNSDNIVPVADTVTHSSVQSDCQQSKMTAHLFNYNSDPVQQYVVSSGSETSLQSEDEQFLPSFICAEEERNCQSLQKSSAEQDVTNVQQICLREQCVFTGNVKQNGDNRDGALLSRKNTQQNFLVGNTVNGNCVQEMAEEISENYTEFAAGVATGSNAWNCTSTSSIGNQNTNAVRSVECMGDAEMNEVESLASEILPSSEVDGLDFSDKFSALTQAHLRDTGISNYHEAETLNTSEVTSDASTVISIHDSESPRVQRSCEDGGSSDSKAVACTDEDMECHSAELHSSNIGCKQKFASG
jgi:hypothetical protein